jgi:branched-chain amino acid transport system permease protein
MKRQVKLFYILIILVLAALCPWIVGTFNTYLFTQAIIFSVFGVSFYLLFGHTGLLSFGHAAYFGIGGYSTGLCLLHLPGLPLPISVLIGALSGLLGGFLIGSMLLRLEKIYFAFGTLAFSQMFWAIAWKWRSVTGGDDGLTGWSGRMVEIPFLGQFSLSNINFMYYLVLFVAVASVLLCWYITKTPLGNTLASIKANLNRANFLGVNTNLAKFMLFGLAGLIAGVSGSLFILFQKIATPDFLSMLLSFDVLLISVIGGYANFLGPIIGSFIYVYMVEYLSSFTNNWPAIMGAFFVILILFFPKGAMGALSQLLKRVSFLRSSIWR